MRAIIVGAVESTRVAIEAFEDSPAQLALVVTLPLEAAKRHSDFVDLAKAASARGAEVHRTRQVNTAETLAIIADARPDVIFVVGWSQICKPEFLGLVPGRVIGYHPAPIPRLRGRAAIPWTILLDEPISAGTLFWMDDGVDSGAILEQHFFHVAPDETAQTLYDKHMVALGAMMRSALAALSSGSARKAPQDERCATYATRRTAADGRIDWRMPAADVDRLIRAVGRPYPGAFTTTGGEQLTVWRSSLSAAQPTYHALPGQIVAIDERRLTVNTGRGLLCIEEWETSGERGPAMHSILGGQS